MKAVNLLPPELRSAPKRVKSPSAPAPEKVGGVGPFVVLGALALALIFTAAYVLAGNVVKDREAELARITAENEVATARAAALKPYGDFEAMAVKRVSTVSSLAALRFDWEQGLRDVSRALPAEVTLSKLEGSLAKDGGGGGSTRAAIASPALSLTGCTSGQSAVAETMSRLRGVRGVTRVSLAKSAKAATVGAGGSLESPCGKGNPPAFELVVFFERSVAGTPPAAPGAGAAPATGTTTTTAGSTSAAGQPVNASSTPAPTPAP
ncbi:MAG: hypothetical protein M3P40_06560 [Actinomycetota bacterium]|nr:hypothetical protein [Actinomycetota bacterium]